MYYIYRITNNVNGKTYIGQHKYKKLNDSYMGSGVILHRAFDKYGKENFTKEILYSRIQYQETANDMEKFAIAKERALGKAEYNIANGARGGDTYHCVDEETQKRIAWSKGKKRPDLSKKMKEIHKQKGHKVGGRKNKYESEDERRNGQSEIMKKKYASGEIEPWNKGKHYKNPKRCVRIINVKTNDVYIGIEDCMEKLHIGHSTVYRWIKKGVLNREQQK